MKWKSARWALIATMLMAGLFVAARMLFGPLTFPVPLHSPMNVESFFGLAAILLLIRSIPESTPVEHGAEGLERRDIAILIGIAILVAGAFWKSTSFYFLSDDFILVNYARSWHGLRDAIASSGGADGFYRPLSFTYLAWVATWAGIDPTRWHAIELVLHAANSCLVYVLAREVALPRSAAALAGGLFAVHATRPEAVVWIAGRADLLSTFFVLAGLAAFLRAWRTHGRAGLF